MRPVAQALVALLAPALAVGAVHDDAKYQKVIFTYPFAWSAEIDGKTVQLKPSERVRFRLQSISRDRVEGFTGAYDHIVIIHKPANVESISRLLQKDYPWKDRNLHIKRDLRDFEWELQAKKSKLEAMARSKADEEEYRRISETREREERKAQAMRDAEAEERKRIIDSWPPEFRSAAKDGRPVVGMTMEQVSVVWGAPDIAIEETDAKGTVIKASYQHGEAEFRDGKLSVFRRRIQ